MKKHLRSMLEALIADDTDAASQHLHAYLASTTRNLVLGEKEDKDEEEKEEKEDEKDEKHEKKESKAEEAKERRTGKEDEDEVCEKCGKKPCKCKEEVDESILDQIDESLLDDIFQIIFEEKPSAGMSKQSKSNLVKKAKKGEDIGKKGKNFKKVAAKAAKKYGSKEAGEKVAAAAMWKNASEGVEYGEVYKKTVHKDNSRGYNNPKGNKLKADANSGASDKCGDVYKDKPHKDNSRGAKSEDKGRKGLKDAPKGVRSPDGTGKKENRRTDKAKGTHGKSRDGKDLG